MTEETATAIADVVLLLAAGAATWFILRDPRLRRVALGLLRTAVTGAVPAYLVREVRTAWRESAREPIRAGS